MCEAIYGRVAELVDRVAAESLADPDGAGADLNTPAGRVQVLPFRHGITDPAWAWSAAVDWAVLIIYTCDAVPEVYVIPAADFTRPARDEGGRLPHVDWVDAEDPGVCGSTWTAAGTTRGTPGSPGYRVAAAEV
jgi:hypothetical protein